MKKSSKKRDKKYSDNKSCRKNKKHVIKKLEKNDQKIEKYLQEWKKMLPKKLKNKTEKIPHTKKRNNGNIKKWTSVNKEDPMII